MKKLIFLVLAIAIFTVGCKKPTEVNAPAPAAQQVDLIAETEPTAPSVSSEVITPEIGKAVPEAEAPKIELEEIGDKNAETEIVEAEEKLTEEEEPEEVKSASKDEPTEEPKEEPQEENRNFLEPTESQLRYMESIGLTPDVLEQIREAARYCSVCGEKDSGHHSWIKDINCPDCGEFVKKRTCHLCYEVIE